MSCNKLVPFFSPSPPGRPGRGAIVNAGPDDACARVSYHPGPGELDPSRCLPLLFRRRGFNLDPMVNAGPEAEAAAEWYSPGPGSKDEGVGSEIREPSVNAGPRLDSGGWYSPGPGTGVVGLGSGVLDPRENAGPSGAGTMSYVPGPGMSVVPAPGSPLGRPAIENAGPDGGVEGT
mmetsp:Transcript_1589/g.2289  ORF Transcript_1589/g.2289 Transcript_1589/m.2289 type:complete len:176 (+) Transcript_1589:171-698(+)